jgi:hypothetical protein
MLNIFLATLLLTAGQTPLATPASGSADADVQTYVVVVADEDVQAVPPPVQPAPPVPPAPPTMQFKSGGGTFMFGAPEDLPDVWLGIRVTPLPAPLQAHLGEDGVMVSNVVVGSPADKAGLAQYDVIVGLNGKTVGDTKALFEVLRGTPAGQVTKMTVVRSAARRDLRIVPVSRPDPGVALEQEMKYAEPGQELLERRFSFSGRALRPGPDGGWVVENLGPLAGMPDALTKLEELERHFDWHGKFGDHIMKFQGNLDANDVTVHIAPGSNYTFFSGDGHSPMDVHKERRVVIENENGTTTLTRVGDGEISVVRELPDGTVEEEVYDSIEALSEADPEAAEVFQKSSANLSADVIELHAFGPRGEELRRRFQIDVRKRVEEAMAQAEHAMQRAQEDYDDALGQADVARQRAAEEAAVIAEQQRAAEAAAPDLLAADTTLGVRVAESGALTIYRTTEDGSVARLEFKNAEALRLAEPELFEEVQHMLE